MCDLEARDTHARADDGLSKPMLPKMSARFDIHLQVGHLASKVIELRAKLQGPGARPNTLVSTCAHKIRLPTKLLKICEHPS
jgi:hypothetical protein